jgi:hypothetical protein
VEGIALIVSLIALVVSGFAAWYAKREASATEGTLAIEKQRELERARPTVVMRFEWYSRDSLYLVVENRGVRAISARINIVNHHYGTGFSELTYLRHSPTTMATGATSLVELRPGRHKRLLFTAGKSNFVNFLAKFHYVDFVTEETERTVRKLDEC